MILIFIFIVNHLIVFVILYFIILCSVSDRKRCEWPCPEQSCWERSHQLRLCFPGWWWWWWRREICGCAAARRVSGRSGWWQRPGERGFCGGGGRCWRGRGRGCWRLAKRRFLLGPQAKPDRLALAIIYMLFPPFLLFTISHFILVIPTSISIFFRSSSPFPSFLLSPTLFLSFPPPFPFF